PFKDQPWTRSPGVAGGLQEAARRMPREERAISLRTKTRNGRRGLPSEPAPRHPGIALALGLRACAPADLVEGIPMSLGWWRKLCAGKTTTIGGRGRRARKPQRHWSPLRLEGLEDRTLLSGNVPDWVPQGPGRIQGSGTVDLNGNGNNNDSLGNP